MIIVDAIQSYPTGLWCHMTSDTSRDELDAMADSIGLKRRYFQARSIGHYDLRPARRAAVLRRGAVEVHPFEIVRRGIRLHGYANDCGIWCPGCVPKNKAGRLWPGMFPDYGEELAEDECQVCGVDLGERICQLREKMKETNEPGEESLHLRITDDAALSQRS